MSVLQDPGPVPSVSSMAPAGVAVAHIPQAPCHHDLTRTALAVAVILGLLFLKVVDPSRDLDDEAHSSANIDAWLQQAWL